MSGSIRLKLLLLTVVPTMVAVLVVGAVLTHSQTDALEREVSEKSAQYAELASIQLRSAIAAGDREEARETVAGIVRDDDVIAVHVFRSTNVELHGYGRRIRANVVVGAPPTRVGDMFVVAMPIRSDSGPPGRVEIAMSLANLATESEGIIRITVAVALAAALLALAFAFPIARRISNRIRNVARYATRIASGDLAAEPLDQSGRDEVAQTAAAVNTMVVQLQQLLAQEAERAADQRRLVLDHVNQGLCVIAYDGSLVGDRSRATESLLGPIDDHENLVEVVRKHDARTAETLALGFAQLESDTLPLEVALFQLPSELFARGRILAFAYTPFVDPTGNRLLVTITDITEERERAAAQEIEDESAAFFRQLATDRHGVRRFIEDARTQIELISTARSSSVVFSALHTLKGNAGLMGLDAWVARCHAAETTLTENGELTPDQRQQIVWAWGATEDRIVPFFERQATVEIDSADFAAIVRLARTEGSWAELRALLRDAMLESTAMPLQKLATHCSELASRHDRRLGRLVVEDHGVRLDPERWGPLWSVLTHVVRNVVIHGMHANAPTDVSLRTMRGPDGVTIEIADAGRGIQWETVRERAKAAGLPHQTRGDLVEAMFTSQISTRDAIDETAGRGVGLAAVAATCRELGVAFDLPPQTRGTMFRFFLPAPSPRNSAASIASAPLPHAH